MNFRDFKRLHIGVLVLTLLLLGGLLGYTLIHNGVVPIALVNGKVLFLNTVKDNAVVAQHLYREADKLFPINETTQEIFESDERALFQKTLESLIVNTIIRSRASAETRLMAQERVDQFLNQANKTTLRQTLESGYGWDIETFRKRVLEPRAMEEVLIEQKGPEYEAWLDEAIASSKVKVWFLPFEWREGRLERK